MPLGPEGPSVPMWSEFGGLGFRGLGFRGLGFRGLGFRVVLDPPKRSHD